MQLFYTLKNKKVVPCDRDEWLRMFEGRNRFMFFTPCCGCRVSTVFLGLDHGFSFKPDAEPVCFETMVFGGEMDQDMDRHITWDEAEEGHQTIVEKVADKIHQATVNKLEWLIIITLLWIIFD